MRPWQNVDFYHHRNTLLNMEHPRCHQSLGAFSPEAYFGLRLYSLTALTRRNPLPEVVLKLASYWV